MVSRQGWLVDVTGYVQADSVAWTQDSVDELDPGSSAPLNKERFLIRRGRVRVDAQKGDFSAGIELDGNTVDGPTARILGATVGYHLKGPDHDVPLLSVQAGLFKTPFGVEVPAAEREKAFLEPPAFARALFPGNYDAGVMAQGGYGIARWSIAMVNGAPVGDTQWKGKDPTASYDLVGRVGASIEGPRQVRVEAGASALTGKALHAGTPPTKDELQWVDENGDGIVQTTELQVVPGFPAVPSKTFDHHALGADLQVHWCICMLGRGTAFAEAALATNLDRALIYADPVAASRDYRELGFSIGFVQEAGRYARFGARYDRYAGDRDANTRAGLTVIGVDKIFSTLALIGVAHWEGAQLTAEYDHERNPFGRGDDGTPRTREADRLTLRAQVGF